MARFGRCPDNRDTADFVLARRGAQLVNLDRAIGFGNSGELAAFACSRNLSVAIAPAIDGYEICGFHSDRFLKVGMAALWRLGAIIFAGPSGVQKDRAVSIHGLFRMQIGMIRLIWHSLRSGEGNSQPVCLRQQAQVTGPDARICQMRGRCEEVGVDQAYSFRRKVRFFQKRQQVVMTKHTGLGKQPQLFDDVSAIGQRAEGKLRSDKRMLGHHSLHEQLA